MESLTDAMAVAIRNNDHARRLLKDLADDKREDLNQAADNARNIVKKISPVLALPILQRIMELASAAKKRVAERGSSIGQPAGSMLAIPAVATISQSTSQHSRRRWPNTPMREPVGKLKKGPKPPPGAQVREP